jgi:hypothetical protein
MQFRIGRTVRRAVRTARRVRGLGIRAASVQQGLGGLVRALVYNVSGARSRRWMLQSVENVKRGSILGQERRHVRRVRRECTRVEARRAARCVRRRRTRRKDGTTARRVVQISMRWLGHLRAVTATVVVRRVLMVRSARRVLKGTGGMTGCARRVRRTGTRREEGQCVLSARRDCTQWRERESARIARGAADCV